MSRLRNCALNWPAVFGYAHEYQVAAQTRLPAPFGCRLTLAESGEQPRLSTVGLLDNARCPSTIAGFVVAVIVDPVERVFKRWARPHIGEEIAEVAVPSGANFNPPAAVVLEKTVAGISASVAHLHPNSKLRGALHVVLVIAAALVDLVADAAARAHAACRQQILPYDFLVPAVALASPHGALLDGRRPVQGDKPLKPLTSQILRIVSGHHRAPVVKSFLRYMQPRGDFK